MLLSNYPIIPITIGHSDDSEGVRLRKLTNGYGQLWASADKTIDPRTQVHAANRSDTAQTVDVTAKPPGLAVGTRT